jgi:hypothetical protein
VVFSISNLDSNSNKVGEEMDLETIIPHNHLYPVLIPHERDPLTTSLTKLGRERWLTSPVKKEAEHC